MSTFNDDLSADMTDPEFAAEFERTTDDVRLERCTCGETACESDLCDCDSRPCPVDHAAEHRRERYAAVLNPMEHYTADDGYGAMAVRTSEELAGAAMAVADYEHEMIREAAELHQKRFIAADAENTRLRAELEDARRVSDQWARAHGARSAETSIARDENARLRAELAEQKRLHEAFKKGTDAGGKETRKRLTDADAENTRLRAELARARQRLVLADEFAKEHSCLTPGYTEGPCHCVHCDPYSIERDNDRLRTELEQLKRAAKIVTENRWYARLCYAEDTISRVRAVLDEWYGTSDASALSAEIRTALNGESS